MPLDWYFLFGLVFLELLVIDFDEILLFLIKLFPKLALLDPFISGLVHVGIATSKEDVSCLCLVCPRISTASILVFTSTKLLKCKSLPNVIVFRSAVACKRVVIRASMIF